MMKLSLRSYFAGLIVLLHFTLSLAAHGQDQSSPAQPTGKEQTLSTESSARPLSNQMEVGGSYFRLTNGYGYWSSGYTRAVYQAGNNVWTGELNGQREFGDAGVYFAAGDTHTFSENWYGSVTIGTSAGGFFWPRFRSDSFLSKKWLTRKQWITTIGYGYFGAKDSHRNNSFFLGSTYYFAKPWIVEEGLYLNVSHPGAVFAPSGFVAVTHGTNKHQYFTAHVGFGEEGYQLIGPAATLAKFESQDVSITCRKWLGVNWGLNFNANYYHNAFYTRAGSSLGIFKEF
ncbi:MAG: YaiO family outer membrane beta-barrel protein [Acidobacteria bacterium]|nr:YaiO family outer membrane beta-barrel protein [Acidobacteriota bacterium]